MNISSLHKKKIQHWCDELVKDGLGLKVRLSHDFLTGFTLINEAQGADTKTEVAFRNSFLYLR